MAASALAVVLVPSGGELFEAVLDGLFVTRGNGRGAGEAHYAQEQCNSENPIHSNFPPFCRNLGLTRRISRVGANTWCTLEPVTATLILSPSAKQRERIMPQAYGQLVDGKWETGTETISVTDKYSGEEIGTVPSASKDDVTRAVGAAAKAFPAYADLPAHRRAKFLARASELLEKYQEDLATIICREAGKAWKFSILESPAPSRPFGSPPKKPRESMGRRYPWTPRRVARTGWAFTSALRSAWSAPSPRSISRSTWSGIR